MPGLFCRMTYNFENCGLNYNKPEQIIKYEVQKDKNMIIQYFSYFFIKH